VSAELPLPDLNLTGFIHVLTGNHAGAVLPVRAKQSIQLGGTSSCDLVLTDDSVAATLASVDVQETELKITVRSAGFSLDGKTITEGAEVLWKPGSKLELGHVSLNWLCAPGLEKAGSGEAQLQNKSRSKSSPSQRSPVNGWLMIPALLALLAVVFTEAESEIFPKVEAVLRQAQSEDTDAVVPHTRVTDLDMSNNAARAQKRLVRDVEEVLRLSRIDLPVASLGGGRIKIVVPANRLDIRHKLESSRALRELQGLNELILEGAWPEKANDLGVHLIGLQSVAAKEPYLIDDLGNRYYPGSVFPGTGRLSAIKGETLVMETTAGIRYIKVSDLKLSDSFTVQGEEHEQYH
jgi:hypothetical protein